MARKRTLLAWLLAGLLILPVTLVGQDAPPPPVDVEAADDTGPAGPAEATTPEEKELVKLRQEQEKLMLESGIRQQQHNDELAAIKAETERLLAEQQLEEAKLRQTLAELQAEVTRLGMQGQIIAGRQQVELAEITLENQKLSLTSERAQMELQQGMADLAAEKQKLETERALDQLRLQRELAELESAKLRITAENEHSTLLLAKEALTHQAAQLASGQELEQMEAELKKINLQHQLAMQALTNEHAEAEQALAELQMKMDLRDKTDLSLTRTNKDVPYRDQPFVDGTLYVSDRRIDLGEVVIEGSGKYVADRIDFFNNQSPEAPIFLVIDDCVGGSVMEGSRIINAIQSSEAPVHVVVKTYAASMAAVILAHAENSYALPGAIMMHHQMISYAMGNATEFAEELEDMKRWQARLLQPLLTRMGLTPEEFTAKLYEKSSTGLWRVFGDEAADLKWVNHLATEFREEGVTARPEGGPPDPWYFDLFDFKEDEKGRPYVVLPRLRPMDFYFIYNPDNYYR